MRRLFVGVSVASLLAVGCTSITVNRVASDTAHEKGPVGQRFALPVPAFLVTPTGDGGVSVERNDLPDPANTFAVDGWAFFAAYNLNVETKNGVLTQMKWSPDSSAVLGQALTSAGGIASEAIKANAAADASEDTAIAAAKLEVAVARAAYEQAKSTYGVGSKEANEALITLTKAEAKLAVLLGQDPNRIMNNIDSVSNDPKGEQLLLDRFAKAPGPMLLVLHVDANGRPSLRPARAENGEAQIRVPIAGTKPAESNAGTNAAVSPKSDTVTVTKPPSGNFAAEIELTGPVAEVETEDLIDSNTDLEHKADILSVAPKADDATLLVATLKPNLPRGKYQFRFNVKVASGAAARLLTVILIVE